MSRGRPISRRLLRFQPTAHRIGSVRRPLRCGKRHDPSARAGGLASLHAKRATELLLSRLLRARVLAEGGVCHHVARRRARPAAEHERVHHERVRPAVRRARRARAEAPARAPRHARAAHAKPAPLRGQARARAPRQALARAARRARARAQAPARPALHGRRPRVVRAVRAEDAASHCAAVPAAVDGPPWAAQPAAAMTATR